MSRAKSITVVPGPVCWPIPCLVPTESSTLATVDATLRSPCLYPCQGRAWVCHPLYFLLRYVRLAVPCKVRDSQRNDSESRQSIMACTCKSYIIGQRVILHLVRPWPDYYFDRPSSARSPGQAGSLSFTLGIGEKI